MLLSTRLIKLLLLILEVKQLIQSVISRVLLFDILEVVFCLLVGAYLVHDCKLFPLSFLIQGISLLLFQINNLGKSGCILEDTLQKLILKHVGISCKVQISDILVLFAWHLLSQDIIDTLL